MYLQDRKKLAKLMVIQDVSVRKMSRAAGWKSHTYLQRLINGQANTLRTEPALLIAHTLGVPVDDLFLTRTDTPSVQTGRPNRPTSKKVA